MEETKSEKEKIKCFYIEMLQRQAPFEIVLNKVLRLEK